MGLEIQHLWGEWDSKYLSLRKISMSLSRESEILYNSTIISFKNMALLGASCICRCMSVYVPEQYLGNHEQYRLPMRSNIAVIEPSSLDR